MQSTGAPNSIAVWFPSRFARRRPVIASVRWHHMGDTGVFKKEAWLMAAVLVVPLVVGVVFAPSTSPLRSARFNPLTCL